MVTPTAATISLGPVGITASAEAMTTVTAKREWLIVTSSTGARATTIERFLEI